MQHTLVLGSGDSILTDPTVPANPALSTHSTFKSDFIQKSDNPKSPWLAPSFSAIKEKDFSEVVTARIEAPQVSTRSFNEANKWSIFTK